MSADAAAVPEMGPREHLCPRRAEAPLQLPGPDRWDNRPSLAQGIGPCCSYCGSLNPEVFMEKIREGWIVGPTDKSYKAYLQQPYTPEELEGIRTADAIWKAVKQRKLDEGAAEDEAAAAADEHWGKHHGTAVQGLTVAKFYYVHLSEQQQHEFIELHNAKAMKIGFPGHFYAVPFFCQRQAATG